MHKSTLILSTVFLASCAGQCVEIETAGIKVNVYDSVSGEPLFFVSGTLESESHFEGFEVVYSDECESGVLRGAREKLGLIRSCRIEMVIKLGKLPMSKSIKKKVVT